MQSSTIFKHNFITKILKINLNSLCFAQDTIFFGIAALSKK